MGVLGSERISTVLRFGASLGDGRAPRLWAVYPASSVVEPALTFKAAPSLLPHYPGPTRAPSSKGQ